MEDHFSFYTPRSPKGKKLFLLVFFILIGLFILLFLIKLATTLWTLKYGGEEEKQALLERVNPSFTLAPELATAARARPTTVDASALIRPFNSVSPLAEAPVKIVAFMDFECPYSKQAYPILRQVMQEHEGVVQVVFKHFPIESVHKQAYNVSLFASCAGLQGKFLEYTDFIYRGTKFDSETMLSYADTLGIKRVELEDCVENKKMKQNIDLDLQDGAKSGLRGTPTFFVKNKKVEGVIDKKMWEEIIVNALQK